MFIVEAVVEGVSHCLASGTNSAYLYEVYGKDNYLSKLTHADNCGTAGFVMSTLSYFVIYHLYDLKGLLLATIVSGIASSICALSLRKEEKNISYKENHHTITKIFSILWYNKVLFIVFLSSILSISGIFISFFYVEKLNISGIPVEWLSIIILIYSIIGMCAEKIVNQFVHEPKWKVMFFSCAISGLAMIVFGQTENKVLVIVLMLVIPLLVSIPSYFLKEIENALIDEINLGQNRATSLSILSMSINLLDIGTLFASSLFTKIGINISFLFVGIMLLIGAFVFFLKQKSFSNINEYQK